MTSTLAAAGLSGVLLTSCSLVGSDSEICCAAPLTEVSPARARLGDTVTVTVEGLEECTEEGTALKDQSVVWLQGDDRPLLLADVDADPTTAEARVTVRIPEKARPGSAEIQVGTSSSAELTVLGD